MKFDLPLPTGVPPVKITLSPGFKPTCFAFKIARTSISSINSGNALTSNGYTPQCKHAPKQAERESDTERIGQHGLALEILLEVLLVLENEMINEAPIHDAIFATALAIASLLFL